MSFKYAAAVVALAFGFTACDKNENETAPALRTSIDAATLTSSSKYTESFKDASGQSTVDLGTAAVRLDMFSELNTYMAKVAVAAPATPSTLDAATLRNYYSNTGAPFSAAALNSSGVQLRTATAASFPTTNAEAVRTYIDNNLAALAVASQSVNNTATPGNAGRLGRYLVDGKGVEVNQVIQKALIGALLLDQIDNVLLTDQALNANNSKTVEGKPYTELEHNWDMAYGYMTTNAIMVTDINVTPRERFLAGYLNEKNGPASPGVYMAFLKGRAAIVNNDKATLKAQADLIRTELEKTIALSAVSYLNNWKSLPDLPAKAHALGEGLGFIYSLRFCTKYGADAAFSDGLLNGLLSGSQGAWSLTNAQADVAINAIKSKFSIQ
ncbi:DUF4856 domain-containing protein [Hymenobacter qilianensis]|uniref:DUF4856 domain-containing protein n=2 Tax=Hymenobacter qilianensis TaxID=1385715 RepID=A0ACB5PVJ9_9BACT|nr:DUF4856 domain-containing protein [Hymenobacter qilianensis]QNP51312.1 DUF4856 domain-containing protein [Hymenobacter qilianensis]GGF76516.1 DUF4856 domain-containing protein [Hymenobacter qilianensis]